MTDAIYARHARMFASEQSGSTAIIFAFAISGLCGAIGLSIDYARITELRSNLQTSLDSALLAVVSGRGRGGSDNADQLTEHMKANWQNKPGLPLPTLTYSEPAANMIAARAEVQVPMMFMRIFGIPHAQIAAEAQGRFGLSNAEVAFALDTTGSMSGTRIAALKTVAKQLIDDVYAVPGADTKVKMAVVPFAQYVNVGKTYRGQPWLNVPNDSTTTQCYMNKPLVSKSGCTTQTGTYYDDGKPITYSTETCTSYVYGPEVEVCGPVEQTWHGCVGSRANPKDTEVEIDNVSPISGIMNIQCASPLARLSNNTSTLRQAVDDLATMGETYMAPGLMWAWRTVSPSAPFADGSATTGINRARKVVVLMSDGQNTASASSPTHGGGNPAAANATTALACQNIKSANVELYTIAFEVTDATALGVLQTCATTGSHFFNATDTTKLAAAFAAIGQSLTKIRLVR